MSAESPPPPDAKSLETSARAASKGGLPPIHLWNPPDCGEIDIHIARDGTWYHEGSEIRRPGLVRLFSTILRKEGDRYVLVTPVEKVGIRVDDAPFVAVDFEVSGSGTDQKIIFETNVGDLVTAGDATPIRITRDPETEEPSPYVLVRDRLEALIDRKSFYRLVDIAEPRVHAGETWFGVWSSGRFFPIAPAGDGAG
ncbi:DUF1285 domain-containing protein [Ovoidimarina sediminis]|uniref:DUF1285 domain-containing protein n=1 Tax=Ovoidimarina sediminis TaxID=3079856 RepID=UPI002909A1EF|nr:DUF1285 domain-containing protein [Rhodophyticola sp. MJ-SS7]MDU8943692.1 DUF1285 domain-containing protein [Rhodophyticola sp. MJ-SS7]